MKVRHLFMGAVGLKTAHVVGLVSLCVGIFFPAFAGAPMGGQSPRVSVAVRTARPNPGGTGSVTFNKDVTPITSAVTQNRPTITTQDIDSGA